MKTAVIALWVLCMGAALWVLFVQPVLALTTRFPW